jgi:monoamine oxidase
MRVDVAIVGAGAAGIAAARTARARGRSHVVLEAKARVGGRAVTDPRLGFPWDRGAQWLHVFEQNPLRALATQLGLACTSWDVDEKTHLGDRWATDEEERAREAFFEHSYETAWAAARAGRDVTVRELLPAGPWARFFEQWLSDDDGSDPTDISSIDFERYVETNQHGLIAGGFGAFLARLAEGLDVRLETPVTAIDWSGSEVRLETPRGTIHARSVVIAVPTPILAAGKIRFTPALPDWKTQAFHDLPLGNRDKVALVFEGEVFGTGPCYVHAAGEAPRGMGCEILPLEAGSLCVAVAHLGADLADQLEREGEDAMIQAAHEQLGDVFGRRVRDNLVHGAATAWRSDPWIMGAYSHARPGKATARDLLARPLEGKLFFAGEACSITAYGTVNGAWATGTAAAENALDAR